MVRETKEEINLGRQILQSRQKVDYLKNMLCGMNGWCLPYLVKLRQEKIKLKTARDRFIECNLRLAVNYSGIFYKQFKEGFESVGFSYEDLVSDFSSVVLPNVVDNWDPKKGAFSTLAVCSFFNRARRIIEIENNKRKNRVSLDSSFESDSDFGLNNTLASKDDSPIDKIAKRQLFKLLWKESERLLTHLELRCIQIRYQSGEEVLRPYKEVSSELEKEGVVNPEGSSYSVERIRQICDRALLKLRDKSCKSLESLSAQLI